MNTGKLAKRVIDFQKVCFDNSFNTLTVMQNHGEHLLSRVLNQLPWLTKEGRQMVDLSLTFLGEARDQYRKNIDLGFVRLEEMLGAEVKKTQPKAAKEGSPATPVSLRTKPATKG